MKTNVNTVVRLIKDDKIVQSVALTVLFVSFSTCVLYSKLLGLLILFHYILGVVVCWIFITYQKKASFCLQRLASFYKEHILPIKITKSKCSVCSDDFCNRHKYIENRHPWKKIIVAKELNDAVRNFYNRILDTFVTSWYANFTDDLTFLNELKYSLRYATATAINKFLEVDTGTVIANKLIPCVVKHIDNYHLIQQIAKLKSVEFDDVTVEYLGKKFHVTGSSRQHEVNYLRFLSEALLPHLLPPDSLKCKNYSILIREIFSIWVLLPLMDVLADPNVINALVVVALTYKRKGGSKIDTKESVVFLENFISKDGRESSLAVDLKKVIKTPGLLYAFMQFLKKEGVVHFLQFCMDVEEFNNKLIKPDLTKKQLENLHSEALNLHKVYLDGSSLEFIECSAEISESFETLLQEGVYHVAKLRTSEPLYRAFDYAFSFLEKEWLPLFYHSEEFYNFTCGSKVTASYNKSALKGMKRTYESPNQGTVSKISSGIGKIKGALKTTQPIEGSVFPDETSQILETELPPATENNVPVEMFRNLNSWNISIPSADIHHMGNSKLFYVFNIHVQIIDKTTQTEQKSWTIQRKEQDFHILKSKLIEFHGETEIPENLLPSRRNLGALEYKKLKYEEFIQKLLLKQSLRGSDLLYTFLTSEHDFMLLINTTVPIGDLGNIYQSVAYKLRKEKGQHLDGFMNTFLNSTGRPKPSKFDWAEQVDEKEFSNDDFIAGVPKTLENPIFGNNYNSKCDTDESNSTSLNPGTITESILYLMKHVFNIPNPILKLYAAICNVGRHAVESLCRIFIERKLKVLLSQQNLTYLIEFLEGVIFKKGISYTQEELDERKAKAFFELENSIPKYLRRILGENFPKGATNLLEILQNPLYNKQLVYNLIDIVLAEMFPELDVLPPGNQ